MEIRNWEETQLEAGEGGAGAKWWAKSQSPEPPQNHPERKERALNRRVRRRIRAETALRLARYFKTNAEFWLNLQNFYDLEVTRRSGKVSEIDRQVQPVGADGD
jgi:hypothetical protein